jgi:hypothetical protein
MDKYKGITNDSVWGLEYVDRLIFVAQSVSPASKIYICAFCPKNVFIGFV